MPLEGKKDSRCYVCGPDNPLGLRAPFSQNGEQGSQARYALSMRDGAESCTAVRSSGQFIYQEDSKIVNI
jgi:hypothetical protein